MRRRTFLKAVELTLTLPVTRALAQVGSGRNIRMIVPLPAESFYDLATRVISAALSPLLGQAIVVDNRAGGAGLDRHDGRRAGSPGRIDLDVRLALAARRQRRLREEPALRSLALFYAHCGRDPDQPRAGGRAEFPDPQLRGLHRLCERAPRPGHHRLLHGDRPVADRHVEQAGRHRADAGALSRSAGLGHGRDGRRVDGDDGQPWSGHPAREKRSAAPPGWSRR